LRINERICKGERTAGVTPPRDVNELLDVTDLLGLYKTCYEHHRRSIDRLECTYHGGGASFVSC
jgi:hypothetical protein